MGAFRELGYGVLFFIAAMLGAAVGAIVWRGDSNGRPPQSIEWVVQGASGGAVAGSALWLWAKRKPGRYGYAAMLGMCALGGAAVTNLVQNPGPPGSFSDPVFPPFFGAIVGSVFWLVFSRQFLPPQR